MPSDVSVDAGGAGSFPSQEQTFFPHLSFAAQVDWGAGVGVGVGGVASAAVDSTLTSPGHKHHISTNFCYFTVGQIRSDYCGCHLDGWA